MTADGGAEAMAGAAGGSRVELFGCRVDALTLPQMVDRVDAIIAAGVPTQHVALNADSAVIMRDDPAFRDVMRSAGLVSPDGVAVVWASRVMGNPIPARVAGPDFFNALVTRAETRGYPVYLLGARPAVLQTAADVLVREHPRLCIAGSHHGYFADTESEGLVAEIRRSGARILFVALPSPQRELWVAEHLVDLGVPFCMALGGALDVTAGAVRRAPVWMQRAGLEWAYRLVQEPRKLWRRYTLGNIRFVWMVLLEYLRRKRPSRTPSRS